LILYRKTPQLRIKRAAVPEPPFWFASAIVPYTARRGAPVAIDYMDLRASAAERLEVVVCNTVRDELERSRLRFDEPVFIDAADHAEFVFRRGNEALEFCGTEGLAALELVSTRGVLPSSVPSGSSVAIAAWPLDVEALEMFFSAAREQQIRWGVVIPVIYPVTTDLTALSRLVALAEEYGASFFAGVPIEADATAKQAIAQSLGLESNDEEYTMLFHADLEPIHTATERHIAALAASSGMADFITPPRWERKTNWNGAVLLTLTATRMIAMEYEIELAGQLARSARAVAALDKSIERIAESAPLSIVQALDEASVDILADWLSSGGSPFVDGIDEQWRLRRDAGM
jgi:hypothetical protein